MASLETSQPRESVAINLTDCKKTFANDAVGLHSMELAIKAGEILVLLGPSGCGKTTLLRLIGGLEKPDLGGRILFNDKDVTELSISKRKIGMVFQSYALFPNMSVKENIAYGLKVRKYAKDIINQKVQQMLSLFDLQPYGNRRINQLSGGQCQRVALARAIITEPDVLLLDEPLSALDALLRERLRSDIQSLLKRLGITAVYVTHDQQEAMAIADRIAVMNAGKIEQIGTPKELYLKPQTHFVADFIGQMNLLTGSVKENKLLLEGGGLLSLPQCTAKNADWVVRPEDLRCTTGSDESFSATVTQYIFLGDRTRVNLVYGEQRKLIMDCFERRSFSVGENLQLTASASHLIPIAN